jgi:hypothetical protein
MFKKAIVSLLVIGIMYVVVDIIVPNEAVNGKIMTLEPFKPIDVMPSEASVVVEPYYYTLDDGSKVTQAEYDAILQKQYEDLVARFAELTRQVDQMTETYIQEPYPYPLPTSSPPAASPTNTSVELDTSLLTEDDIIAFFDMTYGDWAPDTPPPTEEQLEFLKTVAVGIVDTEDDCNILSSIRIAQAILESGWGTSGLATDANNLFGVTKGSWDGEVYVADGIEWRSYPSITQGIIDHAKVYRAARYEPLRGEESYRTVASLMNSSGYAEDTKYSGKLISIIQKYNLSYFDNINT